MVKMARRDTPRKRNSLSKTRSIVRATSRPASATAISAANIRVVVRVRPPNSRERDDNSRNTSTRIVVKVVDDKMLIFDPKEEVQAFFFRGVEQRGRDLLKKSHKDMKFMFDKVFSTDSTTEEVFENSTHSLINSLMDGYNCSVFAYGATGAGKTFTMTGTCDQPGITFLTMTELFRRREELITERDFEVGITYLEVYNELVKDLLNPGPPLTLREDAKYGVTVAGIKVYKIKQPEELFTLLEQGNKNRTQHPTDANAESSRSHAVFQVYLQMTMKTTKEIRTAKLSMIDLAGSERGSVTGYVGARFTEGANINRSLLALGNCINSLADGLKHIPYRDSKLTRLLKDSLGGNCQTVMIANVSPSSISFEDTYNTLKYATRAKKIKSNMKQNVMNVDLHVGHYVKMLEDLKKENVSLKRQLEEEKNNRPDNSELLEEINRLKDENKDLSEQRNTKFLGNELVEEVERLKKEIDDIYEHGGRNGIIDEEIVNEVTSIIKEKIKWLEREMHLAKTGNGTAIRRILKQEINSRISDLLTNTPEKEEAHNKISMAVDRFKKQESAVQAEIEIVKGTKNDLDERLNFIMEKHPFMKNWITCQKLHVEKIERDYQIELISRQIDIMHDDQKTKDALLEEMAIVLRKLYVQLKGHNFLAPSLNKQYQDVVQAYQGKKSIKWAELPDSGISSTTSISSAEKLTPVKKAHSPVPSTTDLDETFTKTEIYSPKPGKQKTRLNPTNQVMTKVIRPLPGRKMPNRSSPNKENRPFRRPVDPLKSATVSKTVTLKGHPSFKAKSRTPPKLAERPRFRS